VQQDLLLLLLLMLALAHMRPFDRVWASVNHLKAPPAALGCMVVLYSSA
jgi:hypothetical protein